MIYLDNNATTQPTARVVEAMLPYMTECYFNASASTAGFTGADVPRYQASAAMAKLLNAEESDCFAFTSGATESNNWVFTSLAKTRKAGRILVSAIEHSSVSAPAAEMSRVGLKVVEIPVNNQGIIRLDALREALREDTALVSIMAANNETGVLEPVAEIGRLIRELCPAALFHTDATQAVCKMPIDLQGDWQDVDLLSFSAHKFHGPKGIGGLYVRPGIEVEPMITGGGQEYGLRAGTTNTPALAGVAAATANAFKYEHDSIGHLRDLFESLLLNEFPDAVIHSRDARRLSNTSCFSLPGISGENMVGLLAAAGIIVGTGSACSAGAIQPSKTLQSMGVNYLMVGGALRVSLSMFSKMDEMTELILQLRLNRRSAGR
jgi:cysteine desulfurase